ncbi:hypothetical protein QBC39DRAFT_313888 [Podospora conica]|nr:hypothetical protein QBC39DRAFT_313888 [Schizothecium conicum]
MDRIFRRLLYLLPGYRRRLSAQKLCTLKIPTELVDMILEHLEPESAIAFSLTCRALFVKHFPKSKSAQLSAPARATLLQWLEQDIPALYMYFCHDCARLHRWRGRLQTEPVMSKCVSTFRSDLTYSWARLVTNRHLYGARHGPPLRNIKGTRTRRIGGIYGAVVTTVSWKAKLIGNNLYLHGTMASRSDGKKGSAQELRAFVEGFGWSLVCGHLRAAVIPELSRDEGSSRFFRPTSGNIIRSCPVCFTDYRILVALKDSPRRFTTRKGKSRQTEPVEDDEDWSIQVARWHNLGECRSPYDLEWCNLVTRFLSRTSVRRKDVCGAGTVRRAWMEEDLGSTPGTETAVFLKSSGLI